MTHTLKFKHCLVHASPGYTETVYNDATVVTATPQDSDEYRANARLYGYGPDTAAFSRDHEILHTFLAEALGFGSSPTLWAVAHGQGDDVAAIWEQEEEESWTLAFQSYLNGGPYTAPLDRFAQTGIDAAALRAQARLLLWRPVTDTDA